MCAVGGGRGGAVSEHYKSLISPPPISYTFMYPSHLAVGYRIVTGYQLWLEGEKGV